MLADAPALTFDASITKPVMLTDPRALTFYTFGAFSSMVTDADQGV
jgi:hypothetical protein